MKRLLLTVLAGVCSLAQADVFFVDIPKIKAIAAHAVETELGHLNLKLAPHQALYSVTCIDLDAHENLTQQELFNSCSTQIDYWIVDSIRKEPTGTKQGDACGVKVHHRSVSIRIFSDGTYIAPASNGKGYSLEWEACEEPLRDGSPDGSNSP